MKLGKLALEPVDGGLCRGRQAGAGGQELVHLADSVEAGLQRVVDSL